MTCAPVSIFISPIYFVLFIAVSFYLYINAGVILSCFHPYFLDDFVDWLPLVVGSFLGCSSCGVTFLSCPFPVSSGCLASCSHEE